MHLPYKHAFELDDKEKQSAWLVEKLWSDGAVGILGGEPKCCKSFLALELAVAVSCGTPCLGRFRVPKPGRVLLYAAEDSPAMVKKRLSGIATARGRTLYSCDIQVITTDQIRLDLLSDIDALDETVTVLKPRLLILDPFVRLHRIDENSSSDVAILLANLRNLQRRHNVAVLVVHHAKKNGGGTRPGQALRGSSEFHAWHDSMLYMRRDGDDKLSLSVEHRAAPSQSGIPLALTGDDDALALEIREHISNAPTKPSHTETVREILAAQTSPMSLIALRQACGIRTATLCEVLKSLISENQALRTEHGYVSSPV